ncbi:MAG: alcohol dehydrogenase, partial [Deltaproteobacteria bacterium]
MHAARIHYPRDLRVEEVPSLEITRMGQVLVKVSAAGICGSDLHVYQ